MSAGLVGELRSGRPPIALAQDGAGSITMRVQVAEMWDAVRVIARPDAIVGEVKQKVVAEFFPGHQYADDFVLKLRGWEMLDEGLSLSQAGVVDGAIVLLAYRRRRPVR